jgi:hypothetical protein
LEPATATLTGCSRRGFNASSERPETAQETFQRPKGREGNPTPRNGLQKENQPPKKLASFTNPALRWTHLAEDRATQGCDLSADLGAGGLNSPQEAGERETGLRLLLFETRFMPPSNWIDFRAIRQTVTMESLLEHYRVPVRRTDPRTLRGKCPLPGHTSKDAYSFIVDTAKNVWACHSDSCVAARDGRRGGNTLDFVTAMENCSLREAALKITSWFDGAASPPPPAQSRERVSQPEPEGQGSNRPLRFTLRGIDPTHAYLDSRGITAETAAAFGVGFYGQAGTMRGRVVIPIHDEAGQLVAYAGRAIDNREPKYRFPAGFKKSLELFNLHRAKATRSQSVIVVEGFFDCMTMHQAGFQNVVALMGSSLTTRQEETLTRCFQEVTLMLDGDRPGREATERIAGQLAGKVGVSIVTVPDGTQPDQLTGPAVRGFLERGHPRVAGILPNAENPGGVRGGSASPPVIPPSGRRR